MLRSPSFRHNLILLLAGFMMGILTALNLNHYTNISRGNTFFVFRASKTPGGVIDKSQSIQTQSKCTLRVDFHSSINPYDQFVLIEGTEINTRLFNEQATYNDANLHHKNTTFKDTSLLHDDRTFKDASFHHDDTTLADNLYNEVKVFCWILTTEKNHKNKSKSVKETWAKRCNKVVFMSDAEDQNLPALKLNVELGRGHLTAKTMQAFDYAYKNHIDEFDWFIKADDDTYIIVENLRYMLKSHSPNTPIAFGQHFQAVVKQGFFSGGAGYVISRESLRRYGQRKPNTCKTDGGAEDVDFGLCMQALNISIGDSRDAMGRSRFHCFIPEDHVHSRYYDWYRKYDKYGAKGGISNISDYAISFHYIPYSKMYDLEFYIYHLRPYGIINGNMKLNN